MAYIEKEPIVDFITKGLNNSDKTKAYGYDAIEILAEIEYAPTVDVVGVKHGHWIKNIRRFSVMGIDGYVRDEEKATHTCSICRIGIVGLDNMNYCPYCGAKMDVRSDTDED